MVWSQQIGTSITVPADKNPSDPTDVRDWVQVGGDLPDELTAAGYSAALLYYNGKYVGAGNETKYLALIPHGASSGEEHFIILGCSTLDGASPTLLTLVDGAHNGPNSAVNFFALLNPRALDIQETVGNALVRYDTLLNNGWNYVLNSNTFSWGIPTATTVIPGASTTITVPAGKTVDVEFKAPRVRTTGSNSAAYIGLLVNGAIEDYNEILLPANTSAVPARLTGSYTNTTGADQNIDIHAQAAGTAGTVMDRGNFSNYGAVIFRYRIT